MNKVLIIGDSSIPPREELRYEDTYTSKLKRRLTDSTVEVNARTGTSSKNIYVGLDAFLLYGYDPDIVVLNYGIVDVYPRPYPNLVNRFLACSGLQNYVDPVLKKIGWYYKLGDLFNFKEVEQTKFQYYSENIIHKLLEKKVKKIIIVGIIKPYKVLRKSKKVDKEVLKYNQILEELSRKHEEVRYIDMYYAADDEFTIWDGYHYTEKASEYLAGKIQYLIQND